MRCLSLIALSCYLSSLVWGEELILWSEGKITPKQPFKAEVIAAGGVTPWSGTTHLYLVELGDKKRICLAIIKFAIASDLDDLVEYKIIDPKVYEIARVELSKEPSEFHACVFSPPLPIDRFAWISPVGKIGKPFDDKDLLQIAALRLGEGSKPQKQADPAGAWQPATRPESKPE